MVNRLIVMGDLLVIAALTGLLVVVEPLATLGAIVALAVPTALIYRATHRRLGPSGHIAEERFGIMIQCAAQAIASIKEIKLTGRRSFFVEQRNYHVLRSTDSMRSWNFLTAIPAF